MAQKKTTAKKSPSPKPLVLKGRKPADFEPGSEEYAQVIQLYNQAYGRDWSPAKVPGYVFGNILRVLQKIFPNE